MSLSTRLSFLFLWYHEANKYAPRKGIGGTGSINGPDSSSFIDTKTAIQMAIVITLANAIIARILISRERKAAGKGRLLEKEDCWKRKAAGEGIPT